MAYGKPTTRIRALPDPSAHAQKQRDAIVALVEPTNAELLYVQSVGSGTVVLRRLDGSVIDEDVALLAAARVQAGDQVARLPLPGSGSRDAQGSHVALGPIKPARAAPVVTLLAAAGGSPGPPSVSGSDDWCRIVFGSGTAPVAGDLFTVTWAVPRAGGSYGLWLAPAEDDAGRLLAAGWWPINQTSVAVTFHVLGTPTANKQYIFSLLARD